MQKSKNFLRTAAAKYQKKAQKKAQNSEKLGYVATHIRSFFSKKYVESTGSNAERIVACLKKYDSEIINENHGIKTQHIELLFIPIGIPTWEVPSTLIADLNSYGQSRGGPAHGMSDRQLNYLNITRTTDVADRIISDLLELDMIFTKILKKA